MSAEMVDLVLDDAGRPASEHPVNRLAVFVECVDPYGPMPGHDACQTGDAQAALVEADLIAIFDGRDRGVDQYGKWQSAALTVGALVLGEMAPTFGPILEDRKLERNTDLWCSEPYSGSGLHGRPHPLNELLQLQRVKSGGVERLGAMPQDRVTAFDNGKEVAIAHSHLIGCDVQR